MTREELDLFYDKVQADVKTLTEEYNKTGGKRTYNFWLGCTTKTEDTNTQTREELVTWSDKLLGIISDLSCELRDVKTRLEKSDNKEII